MFKKEMLNKKAFSLLEIIVAMVFLTLVSVSVSSLIIQNIKLVSNTQESTQGMTIAVNKWVQLLSTPYNNVTNEARTALGEGYDRQVVVTEQTLLDNTKQKNVVITIYKTGGTSIFSLTEIKSQPSVGGGAGDGTPTGMVGYFNLASCPTGWVASNGTNSTVDLRGEFIRGLDSGRGIDTGRTLTSWQNHQIQDHYHHTMSDSGTWDDSVTQSDGNHDGFFVMTSDGTQSGWRRGDSYIFIRNAFSANVGAETRPRNVALLACQKQ